MGVRAYKNQFVGKSRLRYCKEFISKERFFNACKELENKRKGFSRLRGKWLKSKNYWKNRIFQGWGQHNKNIKCGY